MITVNGYKFNKITQDDVEWLKNNYNLKLTEIQSHMGLSDETIYRLLNALGIERERHWKIYLPKTKEVEQELKNPYLSHVKIANKYGVHETTVAARRREMGIRVRRNMASTQIEDAVRSILDELDLAYIPQKRIDQWSIDFYLGRGYCIDVHGEWAHSHEKVVERDKRKVKYLHDKGYKYLVIHESELQNAKSIIQDFALGFPAQ